MHCYLGARPGKSRLTSHVALAESPLTMADDVSSKRNGRSVIIFNKTGQKYGNTDYEELPVSAERLAKDLKNFFADDVKLDVRLETNGSDANAIKQLADDLIEKEYQDDYVIVFYYIGHGEKGELLPPKASGSDGKPLKIRELIDKFLEKPSLRKTPILFFFDCCQGSRHDEGVSVSREASLMSVTSSLTPQIQMEEIDKYLKKLPKVSNILVAHSTLPMLKSYCDPRGKGPIWTYALLKQMNCNQSVIEAIQAANAKVTRINCGDEDVTKLQCSFYFSLLCCESINFYEMSGKGEFMYGNSN